MALASSSQSPGASLASKPAMLSGTASTTAPDDTLVARTVAVPSGWPSASATLMRTSIAAGGLAVSSTSSGVSPLAPTAVSTFIVS